MITHNVDVEIVGDDGIITLSALLERGEDIDNDEQNSLSGKICITFPGGDDNVTIRMTRSELLDVIRMMDLQS